MNDRFGIWVKFRFLGSRGQPCSIRLAIFTEDLGWAVDDLSNSLPPIKERGKLK